MSYKDLEEQIRAWAELETFAHNQKVEAQKAKRIAKLAREKKKGRPPMFIPDRPVRYEIEVILNVRRVEEGMSGDLLEVAFTVPTISADEAEIQAKQQAKLAGFIWRGTVAVERKEGKKK